MSQEETKPVTRNEVCCINWGIITLCLGLSAMACSLYYYEQYLPAVHKYTTLQRTTCAITKLTPVASECVTSSVCISQGSDQLLCDPIYSPCTAIDQTWLFSTHSGQTFAFTEQVANGQEHPLGFGVPCWYLNSNPFATLRFDSYDEDLSQFKVGWLGITFVCALLLCAMGTSIFDLCMHFRRQRNANNQPIVNTIITVEAHA